MLRLLCAAGLLAGCQSSPLSDPLPLDTALLSALPADAPLIIGGSFASLLDAAQAHGLLPIAPDVLDIDDMAGACTADGCALIAEGALSRVPQLADFSSRAVRPLTDGVELTAPDGLVVQARWSGERLRLGHARAVEQLAAGGRLDAAPLVGAIPDGDLWLYARDQEVLLSQATAWLLRRQTPDADAALAALTRAAAERPALAEEITAAALSVTGGEHPEARLWLHCADAGSARQVLLALQAARATARPDDSRVAAALSAVTFARDGALVEAAFVDANGLALTLLKEQLR